MVKRSKLYTEDPPNKI